MAKFFYEKHKFSDDNLRLLEVVEDIVDRYEAQGLVLTARQLYYQLVTLNLIANLPQVYKSITKLLNNAKMAGLLDWDMFEDRTRETTVRYRAIDGKTAVRHLSSYFHMDMWENQPTRVVCIVEKEALHGVLNGVCHQLDIPLLSARGYPSSTAVRSLVLKHMSPDHHNVILHLGDHDPSGIDMTRDLEDRINMFAREEGSSIEMQRLALNMDQIEEFQPPENPAKSTDSRFKEYRKKYGNSSWELDALEPKQLASLVREAAQAQIDWELWDERQLEIEEIKTKINSLTKHLDC